MLLQRFSDLIDRSAIGDSVGRRMELIEKTDPRRIYPENIRSFFNLPLSVAKWFCDLAVRQDVFERRIGYMCPNDDCCRIIADFADGEEPSGDLVCESCESMDRENHSFPPERLKKIVFYRLSSPGCEE